MLRDALVLVLAGLVSWGVQAELTQAELKDLLAPRIEGLAFLKKNAMLLESVRGQNAKNMTLAEIKEIDAQWQAGTSPLIKELQENKPGSFLKKIIQQQSDVYNEAFLTDAQGANVAAYPATSDYWQGDETKFTAAYADGKGEIYIGKMEYDQSTATNAVQISMPMMYNNEAIGVLVIGVKISVLEAEKLSGQ